MVFEIGTHSGSFHADDVLAVALLREFVDAAAEVVRTRDLSRLAACDAVVDVGGVFAPESRRFDHHQKGYQGARSSAGMVLDWLESQRRVDGGLAARMRAELADYVDDVDNGRRTPPRGVPCFASMVGAFVQDLGDGRDVDARFLDAVSVAQRYLRGMRASFAELQRARRVVRAAMQRAAEAGRHTIALPGYLPWKGAYFEEGGRQHPTEFVLFPAEGAWRVMAIPPEPGSFDNKRSLPAAWASGRQLSIGATKSRSAATTSTGARTRARETRSPASAQLPASRRSSW